MLTFGMPSLMEAKSVEELAALCGELGLGFVELNTNFPQHQPELLDPEQLRELARRYGIGYTIHLNDEMPVADFCPAVAAGYCQAVVQVIDLAKKIGAKKLNLHLSEGSHYTMPDRIVYFYEAYLPEYLKKIRAFRDLCQREIGDSGICICVENVAGFRDFQKQALDILLESPAFGLTLDIGHNYCTGGVDGSWVLDRADRLHHLHLHDARGPKQDHLPLGEGELDIREYLKLAERCGCTVLLEVKTVEGLRRSVQWLRSGI